MTPIWWTSWSFSHQLQFRGIGLIISIFSIVAEGVPKWKQWSPSNYLNKFCQTCKNEAPLMSQHVSFGMYKLKMDKFLFTLTYLVGVNKAWIDKPPGSIGSIYFQPSMGWWKYGCFSNPSNLDKNKRWLLEKVNNGLFFVLNGLGVWKSISITFPVNSKNPERQF